MTDQTHGDESQDTVGTGAEISTENEATAIFYDGSDGVPPSGATPRAPAVSSHSSEAETKASAAAAEATKGLLSFVGSNLNKRPKTWATKHNNILLTPKPRNNGGVQIQTLYPISLMGNYIIPAGQKGASRSSRVSSRYRCQIRTGCFAHDSACGGGQISFLLVEGDDGKRLLSSIPRPNGLGFGRGGARAGVLS